MSEWRFAAFEPTRLHLVAWTAQDGATVPLGEASWNGALCFPRLLSDRRQQSLRVRAELAASLDGHSRTAAEWCHTRGLAVAINLGMFAGDGLRHLGYLRSSGHEIEGIWRKDYRAALGLGPPQAGSPNARWVDTDSPGARDSLRDYAFAVQNLRIVRGDRHIVWSEQPRRWSEAALAVDGHGRVLMLFCREALSMAELARRLLAAPLDVRGVMHVEGGPEASLSIHVGGLDLDLSGSYETGFREDDTNVAQWPIPTVLGVQAPH